MLQVGQKAPQFELEGAQGGTIARFRLSDQRGKWVVLFFYPLDFTLVCPTEIRGFSQVLDRFEELGASVAGVSVDSVYSHQAWIEKDLGELGFPLLSDITKRTAADYGVLLEDEGIALRGTFIIDPDGTLRYMVVHDNTIGRSSEETLRVLQALQTGGLCPIDWQPGEQTLKSGG
jgi:peroxiredoxin 2/4